MQRFDTNRKIAVAGLGSMGKRRIRNLLSLGFSNVNVTGFDKRADRREEAKQLYGIKVVGSEEKLLGENTDVFIISVPPDQHHHYMKLALGMNRPFFVEASVLDTDYDTLTRGVKKKNIVAAPSATLCFHPAVKKINEIIRAGELGKLTNFIYHSGQYLPDWHTYEPVSEYYVSRKETGGAREIVPFELSWITRLLGFPDRVQGVIKNAAQIKGAESVDDTYNALLEYETLVVNLVVDIVSRNAVRELLINGTAGQLRWNWDDNCVRVFDASAKQWKEHAYQSAPAAAGYNKNITEQMYVDEMAAFFEAIEGKKDIFNTMEYDHCVLKLLYAIEESSKKGRTINFSC